jgi:hypothetical protein
MWDLGNSPPRLFEVRTQLNRSTNALMSLNDGSPRNHTATNVVSATPIELYEYATSDGSSAKDSQWQPVSSPTPISDLIEAIQLATWNVWFDELEQKTRFSAIIEVLLSITSLDIVSLQEVTPEFLKLAQRHPSIQANWVLTDCWDAAHQKELHSSGKGNIFLVRRKWAGNIRAWVKKFPTSAMERFVVMLEISQGDSTVVKPS